MECQGFTAATNNTVVCFFPLVYFLWEQRGLGANSVSNQLHDIWQMMQLRAVWRPMIFIFTYNIFQVPNVAWSSFLQLGLGFPAWSIGTMNVAGAVMTFLGILAYKKYFFETSWRRRSSRPTEPAPAL